MKSLVMGGLMMLFANKLLKAQNIAVHLMADSMQLYGNYVLSDSNAKMQDAGNINGNTVQLKELRNEVYHLWISVSGFQEVDTSFHPQNLTNLQIILTPIRNQLKDVRIKAIRPIFEAGANGTLVRIENTLFSRSANAQELLGRMPGVSVSGNKINVFGRGEAFIYLNGREISFESFKALPPGEIQSIEIVQNPDARFDAKAKAVILITMKKHYAQGFLATLNDAISCYIHERGEPAKQLTTRNYLMHTPSLALSMRKNHWEFSGYYANELGTNYSQNEFRTSVAGGSGSYLKDGFYAENNRCLGIHTYRFGIGFQPNENTNWSVQYDGLSHNFKLDVLQLGEYRNPQNDLTTIYMTNAASTRLLNHSININLLEKNSQKGDQVFVGLQWNQFENNLLDQLTESITQSSDVSINNRKNVGYNRIRIFSAQVDRVRKLKHEIKLESGLKVSNIENKGRIQFFSKLADEYQFAENVDFANATRYQEQVLALYAKISKTYKKVQSNIGLRAEMTKAKGLSSRQESPLIDTRYFNVFPSARVAVQWNTNWSTSGSYTYKINRPLYQDLDPFLWYLDSLTSIQGNSKLVPEFLHQYEFRLSYKQMTLRYGFTWSKHSIASVMKTGNSGVNSVIFTKDNIQQRITHTVALDLPYEKGRYSGFTTLAFNRYQFNDARPLYQARQATPQWYIYSYHSMKLPMRLTAELTAEYYSPSYDGFTNKQAYYYFTLAVSRSWLKNQSLNVNLLWNDFARTAVWGGEFAVNTFRNQYSQRFPTDYIRLSINYTLHSKTEFRYQNRNVNEAEFNRIKR